MCSRFPKVSDRIATNSENISIESYCDLNQSSWLRGTKDLPAAGANLSSAQSTQALSWNLKGRRLKVVIIKLS